MSDHDHDAMSHSEMPHATYREYMIGFWISVVLTVIPFWLVLADVLDNKGLAIFYVCALGLVQMVVHMVYFLHMNTRAEEGWLVMSLAFTLLLVVIAIAGSVWIMFHLDHNMMPGMMDVRHGIP